MFLSNFNKKLKNVMEQAAEQAKIAEQQAKVAVDQAVAAAEGQSDVPAYDEVYDGPVATESERKSIFADLIEEDKDFSEATFKAKADNIFIQLYTAVMKQDLERVKHFLSDEVYAKYEQKVNSLKESNQLQIYDELNVSDTNITNVIENEEEFVLHVNLLTKYLDYILAKDTRKFIRGDRDVRVEKRVNLVFTKTKQAKELKAARTCQGCGANVDINKTGVCPYCGSIFKLKDYDWVLTEIYD